MKLRLNKRSAERKSESKKFRRAGQIPAVIYVKEKASEPVTVEEAEFSAVLRSIVPGRLATTVFTLNDTNGAERRAIVKEIQYDPTSYRILHLDFEELFDDQKVTVKVPIECVGMADCQGIKLGGTLRQVQRFLRVCCLPKDMPSVFLVDVRSMGQMESKRLSDLVIPETVRPIANMKEVAVVIAKK
jgi:large subunit ribosomal protein L25